MADWRRVVRIGAVVSGVLGPIIGFTAAPASAASKPTVTTIATGLDNPRGLVFGEDGRLFVAEAGHGGTDCVPNPGPGGGELCAGLTGGISAITRSGPHRIVSGLASLAGKDGSAATGPDGLSRNDEGHLFTVMTSCPQQVPPGAFPAPLTSALQAQLGQVVRASGNGTFKTLAGVGSFDFDWSNNHKNKVPGQFPDCNPYAILSEGHVQWVIDAASNTLDRVRGDGSIEIVTVFPNPLVSDAVPTCIARGPDGALYVGELTGGGNAPGASVVWRVDTTKGHPQPEMWASGLTAVTGCGFGANGRFYATEFTTLGLDNAAPGTGVVVRVRKGSTSPTTVVSGLNFPGGLAAGPEGSLYVSNWSILPAKGAPGAPTGEVVRINLHGVDD